MNASRSFTIRTAVCLLAATACTVGVSPRPPDASVPLRPDTLCADRTAPNQLCSFVPRDVSVNLPPGYNGLAAATQRPFDVFSWQSFVALNWPSDSAGNPVGNSPDAPAGVPLVWEMFPSADSLFGKTQLSGCATRQPRGTRILRMMAKNSDDVGHADIKEATGQPLIDRNGNYVMYEIRVNQVEADYIVRNGLTTEQGQQGKTIDFPAGAYADTLHDAGPVGAIEVKAAWRILQPERGDDTLQYHHRKVVIYVAPENSSTGQAQCIPATVGLIGLHIIHKTATRPQWVWSTFEHVLLAPTCPAGASACGTPGARYSLYNAACPATVCTWNQPPKFPSDSIFLWNPSPPYAALYAFYDTVSTAPLRVDTFGTQAVRQNRVFPETEAVSLGWQGVMATKGSVWANYRLIGSQWAAILDSPRSVTHGDSLVNAPDTLGNTALETYIPTTSTCIGCHTHATDAAGQPSDFSFVLGMARHSRGQEYFRGTPIQRATAPEGTADPHRPFTRHTPIPPIVLQTRPRTR